MRTILILSLLLAFGCEKELENCDCNQINIYERSLGVLFPIRLTEKDIRSAEVVQLLDQDLIQAIKAEIVKLEEIKEYSGGIDVSRS